MNVAELVDRVASDHKVTKAEAKRIVDTVLTSITEAAKNGHEVSLPGFGKFKVQSRPERQGRNPRTGETMTFKSLKKLVYQPAKTVRDALNSVT